MLTLNFTPFPTITTERLILRQLTMVGYELHPDFWNRGIMQESLVAIINYGFQDMKLHSIEAVINPDNAATIKLLERNHFVKEAHFKENFFHKNSFQDTVIYSLLNKV